MNDTYRYSFLGQPCPEALAARFPNRLVLFDEQYGTHVKRLRTQHIVPASLDWLPGTWTAA